MPVPVHGTFWLLTPASITLQSVIAAEGELTHTVAAVTLPELLRANIGEMVEVKTADGWLKGKLVSVAEDRTETNAASAISASAPICPCSICRWHIPISTVGKCAICVRTPRAGPNRARMNKLRRQKMSDTPSA